MSYENDKHETGELGTHDEFKAGSRNINMENFKRPKESSFPSPDKNRHLDRELAKIKASKSD